MNRTQIPLVISIALGLVLGLLLTSAPDVYGGTAITDPVLLGAIPFVQPRTALVLVPPLLHLAVGLGVGTLAWFQPTIRAAALILTAVAVNASGTLVENADGAGIMGVGWWLIGSIISAALMLLGATGASRLLRRLPCMH